MLKFDLCSNQMEVKEVGLAFEPYIESTEGIGIRLGIRLRLPKVRFCISRAWDQPVHVLIPVRNITKPIRSTLL